MLPIISVEDNIQLFEVTLSTIDFNLKELKVHLVTEGSKSYVEISGEKHEKCQMEKDNGKKAWDQHICVTQHVPLPQYVQPQDIKVTLSSDGFITLTAFKVIDNQPKRETMLQIIQTGQPVQRTIGISDETKRKSEENEETKGSRCLETVTQCPVEILQCFI